MHPFRMVDCLQGGVRLPGRNLDAPGSPMGSPAEQKVRERGGPLECTTDG